jgi:NADPH:quinone reductase-like Zn-dependent oxidoreductase
MKAFIVDRYSKTTPLREGELPDPELRPDEVLVQVHATSVNPLDFKIRNGDFKLFTPARPPFALGHDVAGVVVRVDQALQGLLATKQTQALLDLQQYRLVLACHPRGELQGPDSKTGAINGQRVVGYGVG